MESQAKADITEFQGLWVGEDVDHQGDLQDKGHWATVLSMNTLGVLTGLPAFWTTILATMTPTSASITSMAQLVTSTVPTG